MTDGERSTAREQGGDALAELIRAAGRRTAPSAAEYERARLASHLAWQMKVHTKRRRRRVMWLGLAAGLAAALGVLVLPRFAPPPVVAELAVLRGRVERFAVDTGQWEPLTTEAEIAAGTRLRTVAEGGAAFALAGAVSVRASGGTSWVFADSARVVLDAGTLYIDANGSAAGGIEITTPHGVVHDLGTQFEVRTTTSELRLRVREGRVQLASQAAAALYEAPAGEELHVTADGSVERRAIATDSAEWSWAAALAAPIELDGGSAFEALQWVARETGKRLVFEDANAELLARTTIIHGSGDGLEPLQILEVVMATSARLDYTLGGGTLVVRRR
jgi:hypothetical protein